MRGAGRGKEGPMRGTGHGGRGDERGGAMRGAGGATRSRGLDLPELWAPLLEVGAGSLDPGRAVWAVLGRTVTRDPEPRSSSETHLAVPIPEV